MRFVSFGAFVAFLLAMACSQTVRNGDVVLEPVATFSGRVQDHTTNKGLGGVSITTSPGGGYATTNEQGEYTLVGGLVPGRSYRVEFAKSGFAPVALEGVGAPTAGETRIADVAMEKTHALLGIQGRNVLLGATANEAVFSISNVGDAADVLSYSISTTAPWLTLTPQVGDVLADDAVITLRADRLLLGSNWGVYTATIDIVTNAGSDVVSVRLIHQPQELGVLTLADTLFDYGGVDRARSIRLDNPGGQPVTWELAGLPSYLTPAATSGTVGAGNFVLVEFQLDRGALLPGTYVTEVRINTNSELQPQLVVAIRFDVPPRLSVLLTTAFLDLGTDLSAKAFGIVNDGNVGFDYDVIWPEPWDTGNPRTCSERPRVSTVPKSGTLPPGGTASVGVRLDRSGLVPGDFTRAVTVNIRRDGSLVEQRVVTVRYVVLPHANIATTVDRQAMDRLHSVVNIRVLLKSAELDPCDMLANVPLQWVATASQPWFNITQSGNDLEMPVVPGGVDDGTASPVGYAQLVADWTRIPLVPGTYPVTVTLDWCSPLQGLPYSCNATHQRVAIPLTLTQPGPDIEKAAMWLKPGINGFSMATVATFNPFGSRLLMGPSVIGFHAAGYYWLEWDLTPGAEVGYQMTAGEMPDSTFLTDTPVNQLGLPGDSSMAYDWAHDAHVFVWTMFDHGAPVTYTWAFQNAAWRLMTPTNGAIRSVRKVTVFYDTKRNKTLMYGGYIDELTPDDTLRELDFETGTWNTVTTALIGAGLDVTRATATYDATQDRYIVHGGKPLATLLGNNVTAVERTWVVNPDTLVASRITPDASFIGTERWGGLLTHNVEQNITYIYGGCFQTGPASQYEACYDGSLHVLLNPGAHPLPIPPAAEVMGFSGVSDGRWSPGVYHLTYDSNYDRMLLTGSGGGLDPATGDELVGASAWQLLYDRAAPTLPTISLSSTDLQLGAGTTGAFNIANNSGTLGIYRVLPIEPWLSADQSAGYLANGTSLPVTVTANTAGLSPGPHHGRLRVEGAAKQVFEVQVEVTAP
jgi:hypothetical protein